MAVAGPLLATYAPSALKSDHPAIVRITSPAEARAEVRRQLAYRPDLIKIWFVHPNGDLEPELRWVRAAIAEAHAAGVRVAAHATQLRVARALVAAGVDVLVHSIDDRPVDDDMLAMIKRRGVVYIATLAVKQGYRAVLGQHISLNAIERRLADPSAIASFDDLKTLPRRLLPAT